MVKGIYLRILFQTARFGRFLCSFLTDKFCSEWTREPAETSMLIAFKRSVNGILALNGYPKDMKSRLEYYWDRPARGWPAWLQPMLKQFQQEEEKTDG
jgi:hypothetical protein